MDLVGAVILSAEKVAGICKWYIDSVANYPKDLRLIFIETKSLAVVFEGLQFLQKDNTEDASVVSKLMTSGGPVEESQKIIAALESLLPAPKPPQRDSRGEPKRQKYLSALDSLAWPLKAEKARKYLDDLVRFKSTICLAIEGSVL